METLEDTRLWQTLAALSARELNAFRKFLDSPYFNQRTDVIGLLESVMRHMRSKKKVTHKVFWESVHPGKPYDNQQLRLLMSYLHKLVGQFLAVESLMANEADCRRRVVETWGRKGQTAIQARSMEEAFRYLERSPVRNADYYFETYLLHQEQYRQASRQRPEKGAGSQLVDQSINIAFAAMKLRQTCLLLAHGQVYDWGFVPSMLEPIDDFIQVNNLLDEPCIGIYWHGIRMLRHPDEERYFQAFKALLLAYGGVFPPGEVQDLYLLAINYGVRRVNDGQLSYFHDIMDFYRDGLKHEYLLQDGQLSRFTYHNIVSVALQIDQADWAEVFIQEWTSRIDRRFRERMESFNRAKIAYYRRRYDEAVSLLQRSNYHDPLLNLGARTLLLKIYFELEEFDALQSHLDAFQNYLLRKPELGYHRANYRHLIRYTRKLLALRPNDAAARQSMRQHIEGEKILTEKEWLLKCLE